MIGKKDKQRSPVDDDEPDGHTEISSTTKNLKDSLNICNSSILNGTDKELAERFNEKNKMSSKNFKRRHSEGENESRSKNVLSCNHGISSEREKHLESESYEDIKKSGSKNLKHKHIENESKKHKSESKKHNSANSSATPGESSSIKIETLDVSVRNTGTSNEQYKNKDLSCRKDKHDKKSTEIDDGGNEMRTQEDYDFIKYHLDMVPWDVLLDKDLIESSEDEDARFQSGKQPSKKVKDRLNSVIPDAESSNEPYSKIKEKMKHKKKTKKKSKNDIKDSSNTDSRREMIREKLLARIEELKGKRNLTMDEVVEKKKLRRKQSKLKLKMRRKEEKLKGNKKKQNLPKTDLVPDKKSVVTPVKDKEGKMVFSKFDFVDAGEKEASKSHLKGKDYKRLLEKVEKKKEKLDKLKETNPQAASKEAWNKVIMKAEGEKIKDDPNLLKKSLKKKEKIKEKKKKQWGERVSQTEHRMKVQQDKRQKNIMARKKAKVDKKIKRSKKKGRMVPGF